MITIYSKENCPACVRAIQLLESKNIAYNQYKIGVDVSREWILESFPNIKTVPIIIDGERLIGSYENLLSEVSNPNSHLGKTFLQD